MKYEYFIENFNIAGFEYDPKTSFGVFWIEPDVITFKDIPLEDALNNVESILKKLLPDVPYDVLNYDNDSDRLEIVSRMKIKTSLKGK
jgi:hypothetical protein